MSFLGECLGEFLGECGWGVIKCIGGEPKLVKYGMVHLFTVGKKDTYHSVTNIIIMAVI